MLTKIRCLFALAILAAPCMTFAETPLALANPGFEQERAGWSGETIMSQVTAEAAYEGQFGLRVKDDDKKAGSSFRSQSLPVKPETAYALRFHARNSGNRGAVGAYLQFFDAAGKQLNAPGRYPEIILPVPVTKDWQPFTLVGKAPAEAVTASIWIHSFNGATGMTDFDNFTLSELSPEEEKTVSSTSVAAASSRRFPPIDNQRVAELALLLPTAPAGLGRPISDRAAWDRLATLPEAASIIKSAEALINTTPPELPDDLYLEFTKTATAPATNAHMANARDASARSSALNASKTRDDSCQPSNRTSSPCAMNAAGSCQHTTAHWKISTASACIQTSALPPAASCWP